MQVISMLSATVRSPQNLGHDILTYLKWKPDVPLVPGSALQDASVVSSSQFAYIAPLYRLCLAYMHTGGQCGGGETARASAGGREEDSCESDFMWERIAQLCGEPLLPGDLDLSCDRSSIDQLRLQIDFALLCVSAPQHALVSRPGNRHDKSGPFSLLRLNLDALLWSGPRVMAPISRWEGSSPKCCVCG